MRYNILLGIAISSLTLLNSCTEDYPIDLSGVEPMLVVNGAISTDTMAHTVVLTKSADYFSNKPFEGVSNALVTISDGTHEFVLQEDKLKKGFYRTDKNVYGVKGLVYTLNIKNIDVNGDGTMETYTATSKLNAVPPIDSISIEKKHRFSHDQWVVKLSTTDDGNSQDFYLFKVLKNNKLITDSISEWGITDDEFYNGKKLENFPTMALVDNKPDEIVKNNDTITLEMYSVTKDYVYHINEVLEEIRGRNPLFGSAPANVRTNISNGGFGFFAAYSVTRRSTVYHEK